jgi:hypothetical protein
VPRCPLQNVIAVKTVRNGRSSGACYLPFT